MRIPAMGVSLRESSSRGLGTTPGVFCATSSLRRGIPQGDFKLAFTVKGTPFEFDNVTKFPAKSVPLQIENLRSR
jgi:hypothetical protein